jgi:hypothetical protein
VITPVVAIVVVANVTVCLAGAAFGLGKISDRSLYGWFAVGNGLNLTACVSFGWYSAGSISAAASALSAWMWWHSGGGDGTKRRMRQWAAKFQGVRRTAPAAAS